jgi:hypothetical protein
VVVVEEAAMAAATEVATATLVALPTDHLHGGKFAEADFQRRLDSSRKYFLCVKSFGFTTVLANTTGACCERGVVNFHSRIPHDTTLANLFHFSAQHHKTIDSVDFPWTT